MNNQKFYQIGWRKPKPESLLYLVSKKEILSPDIWKELGKASVTGYCIRFKTLKDINIEILEAQYDWVLRLRIKSELMK